MIKHIQAYFLSHLFKIDWLITNSTGTFITYVTVAEVVRAVQQGRPIVLSYSKFHANDELKERAAGTEDMLDYIHYRLPNDLSRLELLELCLLSRRAYGKVYRVRPEDYTDSGITQRPTTADCQHARLF